MKLLKNSAIYIVFTFLQKATGILLIPIYTYHLTKNDYGILSLFTSFTNFCMLFFLLSLSAAGTRYYHKFKDDEEKVKELWGTIFFFAIIADFFFLVLFLLLNGFISKYVIQNIAFFPFLFIGLLSAFCFTPFQLLQAYYQAKQEGFIFAIQNFILFVLKLLLILFFVLVLKYNVFGVVLATLIANVLFGIYSCFSFRNKLKFCISRDLLKMVLKYSLPLVPHALAGWILVMIDKIFINNLQSTEYTGVYEVGFQIANVLNTITYSVKKAFSPWFFSMYEKGKQELWKITKVTTFFVTAYAMFALAASLFAPEIVSILSASEEYLEAWQVIPFLLISFFLHGVYYLTSTPIFLKKTYYMPFITGFSAVVDVVLNYLMIPPWGILGASIASAVSMFLVSVILFLIVSRIKELKFEFHKFLFLLIILVVSSFFNFYFNGITLIHILMKSAIIVLSAGIFLFQERKNFVMVKKMLRKKK